jgi:hypothetical protein
VVVNRRAFFPEDCEGICSTVISVRQKKNHSKKEAKATSVYKDGKMIECFGIWTP